MTAPLRSLWFGLSLPARAAALIVRSPILALAGFVPWLLSVALDTWLIHRLQSWLGGWIHEHTSGWVEWIAQGLAWIAIMIAGILAFSLIAAIAALPFNDWLAELTESRATPPLAAAPSPTLTKRVRLLSIDLLKTLCALCLSLGALLMSWIPGVNLIGITLTFLLVTFQFISYPQTRRGEGVLDGVRFLGRNFWACLGFGMSFGFLFALPLVSSLALPLAVVGGTLLYAHQKSIAAQP